MLANFYYVATTYIPNLGHFVGDFSGLCKLN